MKYCPFCGAGFNGNGAAFCSECGKPVAPPVRPSPNQKERRTPQARNRKRPPSARQRQDMRNHHEESLRPRRNPTDDGYDGYYDDVPTADNGQTAERYDPGLAKRIALVAGGFLVIIVISVLVMRLL